MGICLSCRRERKVPEKRSLPGAGGPGKGAAAAELLPRRSDRLPSMANSMSNIKMSNPIKNIVSRRRRRYQENGFNLDLAYITDRLIAMGFPAEKLEGVYRNHIDEVYRFLEQMHKDRYMIYNLCSERSYDSSKFHERVKKYAFEDHMPPDIEIIQPFCEDVHEWLSADPKNVAAVHCKAGKGRTGTMVCCYLLYSGQQPTADEALKYYGYKRTYDDKGVTIPSQRRYVEYYAALLSSGLPYVPCKVHVRELVMTPACALVAAACSPELTITQAKPLFKTPAGCQEVTRTSSGISVRLTHCTPLCGDVRVDVYNKQKMKMRKEKLFHFWFNTFFVTAELGACRAPPLHDSPNLETYKLTLNKWQLDDAHKDKSHKHYSQDFKVELIIQKMPETSTFSGVSARDASPPSSSDSSGSEPDTEPDSHWDSGENVPYTRLSDANTPTLGSYGKVPAKAACCHCADSETVGECETVSSVDSPRALNCTMADKTLCSCDIVINNTFGKANYPNISDVEKSNSEPGNVVKADTAKDNGGIAPINISKLENCNLPSRVVCCRCNDIEKLSDDISAHNNTYKNMSRFHCDSLQTKDGRPAHTCSESAHTKFENSNTGLRKNNSANVTPRCNDVTADVPFCHCHSNVNIIDSFDTKPCCGVRPDIGEEDLKDPDFNQGWNRATSCTCSDRCCRSLSVSTPDDESITDPLSKDNKSNSLLYTLSTPESDPFFSTPNSGESDSFLLQPTDGKPHFFIPSDPTETSETYYKLSAESKKTETSEGFYKLSTNGKKSEGVIKTRLSLGDVRASWREFSGKFTDSRKKKDES